MHGAEAVAETGHATGMPQLNFDTFPNQIFWLFVALVVLYYLLSRIALPRIGAVIAERRGTIANDLAAAEDLRLRAAEAEAAYEKALADARAEAGRVVASAKADIQKDVDAAMAQADADLAERTGEAERRIAATRAEAMGSVGDVARETAEALVAALGGSAEDAAVRAAVDARMEG